jgi:hypothetical protein
VGSGSEIQGGPAGFRAIHVMTFQPQQGQKAGKLVFMGSKSVSIDIPFTLKDVKLP